MDEAPGKVSHRAGKAAVAGVRAGLGTILFLLRIVVPVSLLVALLDWSGILEKIAEFVAPAMALLGLPGEAALVVLSSALLNIYSAIAVAGALQLNLHDATILAFISLTAHNLIVETAVMRKTGSSGFKMVVLRLGIAVLGALALNLILPTELRNLPFSAAVSAAKLDFIPMLVAWSISTGILTLKIVIIVLVIMMCQKLLEEFHVLNRLSRGLAPLMRFFGLPASSSFLWIVINVVGYAYGAGIVAKQIEGGDMKLQEGDLFNHHAGICHSLLEDTALYLVVGIPFIWITIPRLVLAVAVVWLERARRHYFRRSFRAGVT
jgi:hypothetical protein